MPGIIVAASESPDKPDAVVVAVAGPTGSGKSELALRLAERFGGEIVNCDSVQVFRYFNIGTAKLREHEWRGIPHHLIDGACANPVSGIHRR